MSSPLRKRTKETVALGQAVAEARKRLGLSTEELAEMGGTSPGHLRRMELGEGQVNWVTVARLAIVLKLDLKKLVETVETVPEKAERLWKEHGGSAEIGGSRLADWRAKKAVLEAVGKWEED